MGLVPATYGRDKSQGLVPSCAPTLDLNIVTMQECTKTVMQGMLGVTKMGPSARQKLSRLLPSFLQMSGHWHADAMENYLYHPKALPLEPEVQTRPNLTKSLRMGDILSCSQDNFIVAATRKSMMLKFRQNIIQTKLNNCDGETATRDLCALPLMKNILRVV